VTIDSYSIDFILDASASFIHSVRLLFSFLFDSTAAPRGPIDLDSINLFISSTNMSTPFDYC